MIFFFGCRWEVVGSKGQVEYSPFPVPQGGLPAKFHEGTASSQ